MGFIKEFKEFAMKGNVMDMAVGVIIGGAFGKIISSLVDDVLMPLIGLCTGGVDFTGLVAKFSPRRRKRSPLLLRSHQQKRNCSLRSAIY